MRGRLLTQIIGLLAGCASYNSVWAGAGSALPATRPILQHVPDEPSQARAERMVREVYRSQLTSKDPTERRAAAERMIVAARESGDDAAARFVLLREARDVTAGAGDAFVARRAIALMGKFYAIDQTQMLLEAMNSALGAPGDVEALRAVVQVSLNSVEMAIVQDDFARATKLMACAESAAAKTKNSAVIDHVKERRKELAAIFLEYQSFERAQRQLKNGEEDAEECARVGRYLCVYKGDWSAGTALISRGAEGGLKKLVQDDLAAASDPRRRLPVGDGWWELSTNQTWLAKKNLRARAAWWYRQVLAELGGIHRSIAQKRIEEVELAALAEQNLAPGLAAELFRGMEFKQLAKRRVDDQINFDWGTAAADAAVGKDNFGIRWSGVMRPPGVGSYEIVVLANSGARIWIDEKLVLENANLARSRNGARVTIRLDEQLHALRVEFWDSAGAAHMRLLWRRPGSVKDEVIPASVFFHEGLAEGQ